MTRVQSAQVELTKQIRAAMERKGITQSQVARSIGVTVQCVNKALTRGPLTLKQIERIAPLLDMKLVAVLVEA